MGFLSSIFKIFAPSYKVVCKIYNVIPGQTITSSDNIENFDKGEDTAANNFFQKVVEQTKVNKIVPSEVQLYKGKKIIKSFKLGPVDKIKNLKLVK